MNPALSPEQLAEQIVTSEAEEAKYTFRSPSAEFVLVLEHARKKHNQLGEVVDRIPTYDIKFKRGVYRTNDDEEAEKIKASKSFNRYIFLDGEEPGRLLPSDEDFNAELLAAAVELDIDKLVKLREQEQAGHGRSNLLQSASRAIAEVNSKITGTDSITPEPEVSATPVDSDGGEAPTEPADGKVDDAGAESGAVAPSTE